MDEPAGFAVRDYPFAEMHLQVGDRIALESRVRHGERHYATLLGYAPGESVLVRTPIAGGLPVAYADGEALTVHAFTGLGIFSFDTAIQRICTSPFHYLHLTFPECVRGARIRDSERVRVTLPTEITVGSMRLPAVVTDLGVGGALIECAADLQPGEALTLHLALTLESLGIDAAFDAPARVQRRVARPHPDEAVPLHDYGVAFGPLTTEQRLMLQNFVCHHWLQDPRLRA